MDPALYSLPTLPNSQAEIPIPIMMGTGDNCLLIRKKLRNKEIETTVHKKWQHKKFLCSFCHVRTAKQQPSIYTEPNLIGHRIDGLGLFSILNLGNKFLLFRSHPIYGMFVITVWTVKDTSLIWFNTQRKSVHLQSRIINQSKGSQGQRRQFHWQFISLLIGPLCISLAIKICWEVNMWESTLSEETNKEGKLRRKQFFKKPVVKIGPSSRSAKTELKNAKEWNSQPASKSFHNSIPS